MDLNSRNGTFVNNNRISKHILSDGDEITLGNITIRATLKSVVIEKIACNICGKDATEEVTDLFGKTMTFHDYTCSACQDKTMEQLANKKEVVRKKSPVEETNKVFQCFVCKTDLTSEAGRDGLAYELEDSVYLCQQCTSIKIKKDISFLADDQYILLGEIGRGGMGIVYRAVHKQTRRLCAVKKIHPSVIYDDRYIMLFEREIAVQSKVIHPNLVRLLDKGVTGETCYFVSEYLPGGSISNMLMKSTSKRIPAPLACSITIDILKGLSALHDNGFIHRDIKPSNFLLSLPNKDGVYRAKICDYGLAKSYEDAGNSFFDITKTGGGFAGSIMYMSPELIKNYKYSKPPVDVYSVGVSLYYMLTGNYTVDISRLPSERSELSGLTRHAVELVLDEPAVELLKREPTLPLSLARVVDKAVSKNAYAGFQTASEFREELEKVMMKEGWC
ncbi:Serine/threonine protein kinase-like protein [Candidatus Magnetobacterium bavaricum]|uniref:Serine/threonine protein kinase-like protein n=1 Tax=Candidatus Magnetobacterium bavaricum TaxID=29290 RepID=A0A0F3GU01_9BACT|nr:Serine/threonine protein kinase-like protein [Candidatus Magnetobacterium bavaricum]